MTLEPRHHFHERLNELEQQTMGGLDLVALQLERSLQAVGLQDVELAEVIAADDDRIDGRYLEVHQGVLSLLATQTPVAGDLRVVAALLHIVRCVERMGDQCVNIAKLVALSGNEPPRDRSALDTIDRMGQLVREQVGLSRESFVERDVALAEVLTARDDEVNRLNREIFRRAIEIGDDLERREWAMFMVLVARALERIGDNAVDVAEQTVFVVSGLFREFEDAPGLLEDPGLTEE
jgi:phosphate transport system protein